MTEVDSGNLFGQIRLFGHEETGPKGIRTLHDLNWVNGRGKLVWIY